MIKINYKPMIFEKIDELREEAPDYSFGEMLYSFLRKRMLNNPTTECKLGWLREVEDCDFYTALERAIELEKDYNREKQNKYEK